MRLLHSLAKTHVSFDDPNLVSRAGLVPVMALAQRAALGDLVREHVRPGGECGVNAPVKIGCLVAARPDDAGVPLPIPLRAGLASFGGWLSADDQSRLQPRREPLGVERGRARRLPRARVCEPEYGERHE